VDSENKAGNGDNNGNDSQKKHKGYITLKKEEHKLFNFLKTNSAEPDKWPSINDIHDALKHTSLSYTYRLVNSLINKDGIDILSRKDKKDKKSRFGLSPQVLEILVKEEGAAVPDKTGLTYHSLYLAEPTFGTKAFDDKYTMKGLSLFLEVNKLSDQIQQVIVQGGVIPHVPPYSSTSYLNDLKFLGYTKRNGHKKGLAEKMLEEKISNEYERRFYEEHINNSERKKITDLTEAFSVAEEQMKILMDKLPPDTSLRIQLGEEDHKNIKHIEDAYVKNWSKEKKKRLNKMDRDVHNQMEIVEEKKFYSLLQENYLELVMNDPKLMKNPQEKRNDYLSRIVKEQKKVIEATVKEYGSFAPSSIDVLFDDPKDPDSIKEPVKEIAQFIYWVSSQPNKKDKMNGKIAQIYDEIEKSNIEKKGLESKMQDINDLRTWTENLLEGDSAAVSNFTKQFPVISDEVELIFKKAKDRYTAHFFSWDMKQHPVVHVSPRKNIIVDTGIITDLTTGKNEKFTAEVDLEEFYFCEKKILLIHNIRSTFSDAVSPKAIKEAKLEMNYQNMVLKKMFEDIEAQPDITLLGGHMSGGFRVMPWFKDSEHMIKGEFVKGQEISYLINLPTLQSIPNLQWLMSHNFKNWHIKEYLTGPFASAAILHSEDKEKVNKFLIIDTKNLMDFGKIAEEIDTYRTRLESDKDIPKEERDKILKIIKKKKDYVKFITKRIEIAGDHHIGAPDELGHYSKDQFIAASQTYQREHELPFLVSWDEVLHGSEERIFNNASRQHGLVPEKFKQSVAYKIMNDPQLSDAEKVKKLASESLSNMRANTIHNISEQKHIFKILMKPYAESILKKGGQLVLMSGNHHNKSQKTADEALELANQFDESYIDNGKIHLFDGKGSDFGSGTIPLPGGQKYFAMHKFPENQDELYGVGVHLRKMNNDADIVGAGDRHQTGVMYADAHVIVLHPGYEPINKFVNTIGKPGGLRGFINLDFVPDIRGIYAASFVLNQTLEGLVERDNIF